MSTKHTQTNWPASTCVECGRKIPSGVIQDCLQGGWCRWAIPTAYRNHMEREIKRLRAALEEAAEGLELALGRLGCAIEGNDGGGAGRHDADSFGGIYTLRRIRAALQPDADAEVGQ